MLFNSFPFIGLLLVTFTLYYLKYLQRYQLHILILASLFFYAYKQPALLALLLSSATLNSVVSFYIIQDRIKWKRSLAVVGVAVNLLLLVFFKYGKLLAGVFDPTDPVSSFLIHLPLPIGISFFTFEGISLIVDVFKGKLEDRKAIVSPTLSQHLLRTIFFISFFPHLIAGPILKANEFYLQMERKHLRSIQWEQCFKYLVLGYFFKMVVADNLKDHTFWLYYPYYQGQSTFTLLALLFGYACQIFADFAGYSFIAMGLAGLFGYQFVRNFDHPYVAASLKEFWKRWHISLSSFLMNYLYIPLGGNRKGEFRTYLHLMITMTLGGLWHGAASSYAVWGAYHGSGLAIERFFSKFIHFPSNIIVKNVQRLLVFAFVTLGWLLFVLTDIDHVLNYLFCLKADIYKDDRTQWIAVILIYSSPVILYHLLYLCKSARFFMPIKRYEFVFYATLLFLIITNSGMAGTFIYFQF